MDCLVFIFKLMKLHHTCKARTSSTLAEESSVHIVIYSSQDFSESFLLLLFDTILPYASLTTPSSNALFQNCLVRYRHAVFIFTIFLRGLDNIFEVWRGSSVTILNCFKFDDRFFNSGSLRQLVTKRRKMTEEGYFGSLNWDRKARLI